MDEFLLKLFVTRWIVFLVVILIVGEAAQLLWRWWRFAGLMLKIKEWRWLAYFWPIFFVLLALFHTFTFDRHFGNRFVALSAGILVGYFLVKILSSYAEFRRIGAVVFYATSSVFLFPLAVKLIEPTLIKILLR